MLRVTDNRRTFRLALVIAVGAITNVVLVFFIWSRLAPSELTDAKDITLTPSDVELPSVKSQLDWKRKQPLAHSTRYAIRQNGNQFDLYFVGDGKNERVTGDMPTLTGVDDHDFRGFADVNSPLGITTYVSYVKYKALFIDGLDLVASELYALSGNRVHKVLSHIRPAGINNIDNRTRLNGYLDQRSNLFVLTEDGTLCVVRDGQIVGKANVRTIGVAPPPGQQAFPSMFSDAENTYLFVMKRLRGDSIVFGPVNDREVEAKYKIDF